MLCVPFDFSLPVFVFFHPVSVFTCVPLVDHVVVFKHVFFTYSLSVCPDFHMYSPVLCSRVFALVFAQVSLVSLV